MEPEQALYAYLTSHADVAAVLGDRIFPAPAPEDAALPLATYFRVSTYRVKSQTDDAQLAMVRIQFTVRAEDYGTVKQGLAALRKALDGFRGDMAGLEVGAVFCENDRDEFGYQARLPAGTMDVIIWYREV